MRKILVILVALVCLFVQIGCENNTPNKPDNNTDKGNDNPSEDDKLPYYSDLTFFYTEPYLKWDGSVENIKSYMKGKGWKLTEEDEEIIEFKREMSTMRYYKHEDQILLISLMKPDDSNKLVDYIYNNFTEIRNDKYLQPEVTRTSIFVVNNETALVLGDDSDLFYFEFVEGENAIIQIRMAYTTPEYMKTHQVLCNCLVQYLGTYLRQGTFIWPSTWKI